MKITRKEDKLHVEIPITGRRYNPYEESDTNPDGYTGDYDAVAGLIIRNKKNGSDWTEYGFCHMNDMDYANKGDQPAGMILSWSGDEKSFLEKCRELKLDVHEITV